LVALAGRLAVEGGVIGYSERLDRGLGVGRLAAEPRAGILGSQQRQAGDQRQQADSERPPVGAVERSRELGDRGQMSFATL
jgi:hypothetical protein